MKAFRRFTARLPLPTPLADLDVLAANLRWVWHRPTQELFASIDDRLWAASGDPLTVLGDVSTERLAELAASEDFRSRVAALRADLDTYLRAPHWFADQPERDTAGLSGIGYFSMEFGVTEVLPIYSGGLGILAGDHLKAASDLGLPLIGVGLYYRAGYFRQGLDHNGWQQERYVRNEPGAQPLSLLRDDAGKPVIVEVTMPGAQHLHAQIWVASVGRVPLLLLDSDIDGNSPEHRLVTDRLYGGNQRHRIEQEILLGIGGVRALREFIRITGRAQPAVFHLNEGHAGFLGVERIRELMSDQKLDFDAAEAVVRASSVFTTHTPVPAGIDRFPLTMVAEYLDADGVGLSRLLPGVPVRNVLDLGDEADPDVFNMAHMGFRLAQRTNGVSQLHGAVSRAMFADLWPGFDAADVPIGSVTNGVHGPTWVDPQWHELSAANVDSNTGGGHSDSAGGHSDSAGGHSDSAGGDGPHLAADVDDAAVWDLRSRLRAQLVAEVRRRACASGLDRGFAEGELGWTAKLFDDSTLTIGFARRAATYKRLTLMLRDPHRLRALLTDPDRPIQLIIAGKAHPADDGGKALIQQVIQFAADPGLREHIVFLPDYDISMAKAIYAGCDVWLNNPIRPMEACGTSGMKAALNGGLNLSILDGWWDEMADADNGWAIPSAEGVADEAHRDDLEAESLYGLLEESVIPAFYDRDSAGVPTRWVQMVRHTIEDLAPKVLASRMVSDYTRNLYEPAAQAYTAIIADDYRQARDLASYRLRVDKAWGAVRVHNITDDLGADAAVTDPASDGTVTITVDLELGGLLPDEVSVQALCGRLGAGGSITDALVAELGPIDAAGAEAADTTAEPGRAYYSGQVGPVRRGQYGYAVRVLPRHAGLADVAEIGLVRFPD